MKHIDSERLKDVLLSIFVGAAVAFFTVFLEGALELLRGYDNHVLGGLVSSLAYISRHIS